MTETVTNYGPMLALLGAALCVVFGGIGSSIGTGAVGQSSAGVTAEKPDAFGKLLVLCALPGSQAIYGLIGAFLIINFFPDMSKISLEIGGQILMSCFPLAITSLSSAIFQGKVAAAGANIVAKNPADAGKGIILAAMVETFAILGLLATFILLNNIRTALEATTA